jgi:predicted O-methyltransferase YrrM
VKEAGYFVAFASHYLVHNLGHWASEFQTREAYYVENYRSKPVGEQGWRERLERWQSRPRPKRKSFLLPHEPVSTEKSEPNAECSEPWLWSMFDGWTAELETIEFLYALVRLVKPRFVLETGTWHGMAALAMGSGLRDNGRGALASIELDTSSHAVAQQRIRDVELENHVRLVRGSSLEFMPDQPIDMALFDSELSLRGKEFAHYQPYLAAGALVLFHDTSITHSVVAESVNKLLADGILEGFFLPTPRGLAVCRYRSRDEQTPSRTAEKV